jgi:hypothetical protein
VVVDVVVVVVEPPGIDVVRGRTAGRGANVTMDERIERATKRR